MTETSHILTGVVGERLAARYLEKLGYTIVERNYRKKWGELDLVALKDGVLHFVEVKSTGRGPLLGTEGRDKHRPEDHVDAHKRARLKRAIETYVLERKVPIRYTADLIMVRLEQCTRRYSVEVLWDIEL